jgi:hypothetical protein
MLLYSTYFTIKSKKGHVSKKGHDEWHYEKTGILTVCSVYRMLVLTKRRREDLLESRLDGSNTASEGMQWQQLWKIQVPSKFKYFCGG